MVRLVTTICIGLATLISGQVAALDVPAANPGVFAQDSQGNFIVGTSPPSAVVKIQAGSGLELWRYDLDPIGGLPRIVVAPNDDVIVGGILDDEPTVVRLDAATGLELWRSTPPANLQGGKVHAVALTSAGDVVVAMFADRGQNSIFIDMDVFRLSGATGEEVWHQQIDGTGNQPYVANYGASIAVDGDDNVLLAGSIFDETSQRLFVSKLLHDDGAVAWFRRIIGPAAAPLNTLFTVSQHALAVGNDGSIAVVGVTHATVNSALFQDVVVNKLDPATGNDLWSRLVQGRVRDHDSAFDVAFDGDGGVIATARVKVNRRFGRMVTVKFAADGTPLWTRRLPNFVYSTFGVLATGESFVCGERNTASGRSFSLVQKLRDNGRVAWRRRKRDSRCRDIMPQSNGDVLAVGVFDGVDAVLRFASHRGQTSEP